MRKSYEKDLIERLDKYVALAQENVLAPDHKLPSPGEWNRIKDYWVAPYSKNSKIQSLAQYKLLMDLFAKIDTKVLNGASARAQQNSPMQRRADFNAGKITCRNDVSFTSRFDRNDPFSDNGMWLNGCSYVK